MTSNETLNATYKPSTSTAADQEDYLIAVLQPTTANMNDNTTIRQSPANISQVQGSVKRFHRTLTEQVRAPKSQLQQNHNRTITSKTTSYHGRYDAQRIYSPGTRYTRMVTPVTSAGGTRTTSSHREFGETPQQHTHTHTTNQQATTTDGTTVPSSDLDNARHTTGESLLGIANRVVQAGTIRRMTRPESATSSSATFSAEQTHSSDRPQDRRTNT